MAALSKGRPRSERAKNAILNSTYRLLKENGLSGITMEAVAAHASVGKPTIYRYWKNANELAMAAIMAKTKQHDPDSPGTDPVNALKQQLRSVISTFSKPAGRQIAILMASADNNTELSKAFRNQIILRSRDQGRALLIAAIEDRHIRVNVPQKRVSARIETMLDMIYGPVFYRLLSGHATLDKKFADEIIDTLTGSTAEE